MKTGSRGTFVISWSQTETDGIRAATPDVLAVGASWRWTGAPVRVDGPQSVLVLEAAENMADIRKRAARMVRRLIGASLSASLEERAAALAAPEQDEAEPEQGVVVTDGLQSWCVTLIAVPDTGSTLAMFVDDLPPADRDLWVVRTSVDRTQSGAGARQAGGVICFTPDTRIATPDGPRLIQHLRPGDRVLTRDNGPQEILWTGSRRMSGARLYAMPHLRPVRFRAGAFGSGRPEDDLLVSPQHRMLVTGAAARALFNTDEVLVAAEDLLNDHSILVDHALREVTYVHLLLEGHNIVFANGMETESFHPANTALDTLSPESRASLLALMPRVEANPERYGDYARRNLSASEAAILRHDMAA
ncbi:Hint domain-containing protein [Gemmobacter caeni]|uniref:Hint domain-containing protein n=1 Tax=Gemmobacter caeni TaxID=589035 RepID=A0A2T6ARV8_9RHOB|nr:Hint domain-containing protein [Gemmobacter caeni]PTX46555.1 Hint domain-containing protein [Gemmobacter caeni]TWI95404.1 Hint domain-containing protein [Gemmobacter caeni]